MGNYAIIGGQNTGKTMIVALFLTKDYLDEGRKIYSNFRLAIPHTYLNKELISILSTDENIDLRHSSIAIDEGGILFNSRRAMSNDNVNLNSLLAQVNKQDIHLYMTAQTYRQLDSTFMALISRVVEVQRILKFPNGTVKLISPYCEIRDLGKINPVLNNLLYIRVRIKVPSDNIEGFDIVKQFDLPAMQFFDIYNTYERKYINS